MTFKNYQNSGGHGTATLCHEVFPSHSDLTHVLAWLHIIMTQYSYHTSLNLPFTSFNYLTQHFIHQKLSLAPFYNPLKQNLFFYPLTLFFPPNIANKTQKNLALRANIHLGKKIIFKQRGGENLFSRKYSTLDPRCKQRTQRPRL